MKILMVHHFGDIGGGTNSCFDICRMLIESGHDVVLAIPNPCNTVVKTANEIGVRLEPMPVKSVCLSDHNADPGFAKSLIKYVISRRYIGYWESYFQKENPDLIMLNSSIQGPMIKIAHRLGFKTICFIRETARDSNCFFLKRTNRNLLALADGLAFLTNYDVSSWSVPGSGCQAVIPDIVDVKRLDTGASLSGATELAQNPQAKCVLYLGGFHQEKGALELLRAFQLCVEKEPELYLAVLGDTSGAKFRNLGPTQKLIRFRAIRYHQKCAELTAQINKDRIRVINVGLVSDVSPWYKRADVMIFPVKKVHQARPVYEAGVFCKPVIVPDYPHFRDNVIDGYNGLTYRPQDIRDMAETILKIFEDETQLRRMGENNYQIYFSGHTYGEARRKLDDLIRQVMNQR